MEFTFSKHALEQMEIRGISNEEVLDVVAKYDDISTQSETVKVFSKILEQNSKSYLYRVFVNRRKNQL